MVSKQFFEKETAMREMRKKATELNGKKTSEPNWLPSENEIKAQDEQPVKELKTIVDFSDLHPDDALAIVDELQAADLRAQADFNQLSAHVQRRPEVPVTLAWIGKVRTRLAEMESVLVKTALIAVTCMVLAGCGKDSKTASQGDGFVDSKCVNGECAK